MPQQFEDLIAWQKARKLTNEVYRMTRSSRFSHDLDLVRQLRRAAVSVMSNIAEGYERDSDADFARFLSIARGSCGEVRCQPIIAADQGYIDRSPAQQTADDAAEISRIIRGLSNRVRQRIRR